MLKSFSVRNFKNFQGSLKLDLSRVSHFEFNKNCIKNSIVNNALIYGPNGSGKSNLGFAIFDIINHLTDKFKGPHNYHSYLNADSKDPLAEFEYNFDFDGVPIKYFYMKSGLDSIEEEELYINDTLCLIWKKGKDLEVHLDGTNTLNRNIGNSNISAVKYVSSNTVLVDSDENRAFHKFIDFVDRMLFFRSLRQFDFIGYDANTTNDILDDIIESDRIADFENFLHKAKVNIDIDVVDINGKKTLVQKTNNRNLNFFQSASTGTQALTLFYFWLQRIKKSGEVSFVFIDEFDAYYHHELSRSIIEELIDLETQTILTSHNTSLISNDLLRPDCYFLLHNEVIKPLTELTPKDLRAGHNLEKMYKSGAFDVR